MKKIGHKNPGPESGSNESGYKTMEKNQYPVKKIGKKWRQISKVYLGSMCTALFIG
jgi:hypothetical protein